MEDEFPDVQGGGPRDRRPLLQGYVDVAILLDPLPAGTSIPDPIQAIPAAKWFLDPTRE